MCVCVREREKYRVYEEAQVAVVPLTDVTVHVWLQKELDLKHQKNHCDTQNSVKSVPWYICFYKK